MTRRWRGGQGARAERRDLDAHIEIELAKQLVRQAPAGFAMGVLVTIAVVLVLRGAVPAGALVGWLVALIALSLPAFVVVWRFGRDPEVGTRLAFWRRALTVAYALAGLGWGAAAVLLYPGVGMAYQLFLIFIIGGAAISGMAALAPLKSVFVAYVTATFLPLAGVLLSDGSLPKMGTALVLLAFLITVLVLASHFHALLVASVRLRFENLDLIDDLSDAKEQAEAASRAKSLLLANVGHELRTPLALILGPTRQLLSEGAIGDHARRELETVERSAQALLKHVNDLLDVAKLDAGRMEIETTRVDAVALVRRTASLFDIVAAERRIELSVDTPDALEIVADQAKIERVLLNLLSNAMKFVPEGGHVSVGLSSEGTDAEIAVEDDGPGVPASLREAIFERFHRGDEDTMPSFGGTGLGLAIVKEIVERHDGRISVGKGARGGALFRVTLPGAAHERPVADVEHDEPAPASHLAAEDRAALGEIARQTIAELLPSRESVPTAVADDGRPLVLVVEDNPDMRRFLTASLSPDYRVATAIDGRDALAKAVELRPDLVLTDVMMPAMGGDELVRQLRSHPELGAVPIIVLTAKADDGVRLEMLREGAHDFLTKPVASEELRVRVANCVTLKRTLDVLQGALSSRSRDVKSLAGQLAAANRAKDEFLAILSHELRTPLTPILSWSSLLRSKRLEPQTIEHGLKAIERNAQLQVRIIDDLLDVSRAIAGKLRVSLRPTALDPVVQMAVESVRPAAEAKGVDLQIVPDPESAPILGDPERLQQVVWNLMANAIKFTPRGGRVEVRSERVGEHARLTVRDTGVGIDPAALPHLFERFWQADSTPTRRQGGLGLGLAVVRHLVELHGGAVSAASEGKGAGATFTVTLPVLVGDEPALDMPPRTVEGAAADSARLRGVRVLVVDDDLDTCEIVGRVLESAGADVRTCLSADEALATMDRWLPDILVSDIAMPGEDGFELIRKVRARTVEEGGGLAAVALSAYGRAEDRRKALAAGFHVHVGKPIEPDELVDVVARATQGAVPAQPA